jgi:Na+-driven multidrug efflux pump
MFSLATVLMRCLTGAGDTLPVMLIGMGDLWMVRLPLAFLLPWATNLGVYGVRWAMVIGMAAGAVADATYFRMGRWKRKKV